MAPFLFMPFTEFVSAYGLDDTASSFELLYELTKRFTAEFAIRPFIVSHPAETMALLKSWAHDPDPNVRRLVSEGTRPRLPWAPRLRAFQQDPSPVIELLEMLKDDPELYVRRSVANNLNDIGKDHPDLLIDVCRRWQQDATPERQWLIQHALRFVVKRGDASALALLGHGEKAAITIEDARITPKRARIGGTVEISFAVRSTAEHEQQLLIDLRVYYVKADRSTSAKVFKLRRLTLAAHDVAVFKRRLSLRQLTTRTHHPGKHRLEAVVNGAAHGLGAFTIVPGT
jgi:3-methyladenine DNA glycosylase AlkC